MRDVQALALVLTFVLTTPTLPERAASEKRLFLLFLLRSTLDIDVKAHFVRFVTRLRVCTDVRARATHL